MGSEIRKRKAPVPPAPNDLSATLVETHRGDAPVPLPQADATHAAAISVSTETTQSVKASLVKTGAEPALPGTPTGGSISSSSSSATNSSLAAHDSSSELSHSIDDSDQDQDQDQDGSQCSSIASSSASSSVVVVAVQRVVKAPSSSGSDGESELNLKLDEVENRHSAVGKYLPNASLKSQKVYVI